MRLCRPETWEAALSFSLPSSSQTPSPPPGWEESSNLDAPQSPQPTLLAPEVMDENLCTAACDVGRSSPLLVPPDYFYASSTAALMMVQPDWWVLDLPDTPAV